MRQGDESPVAAAADRPGRAARRRRWRGPGSRRGATLRRAGIRLGFYDVRDLLFHLPRRYDDLREMQRARRPALVDDGDGRLGPGPRRATSASSRRSGAASSGRSRASTTRPGTIEATWFGRRYIERRLQVGQRGRRLAAGSSASAGKLTLDNPEFQAVEGDGEVLHAGRIVPVYRLTAGLTAARLRVGHPRGARPRRPDVPGVPARPAIRAEEGLPGDRRPRSRRRTTRDLRGPRRRPAPARLRRAAGAPARAWSRGAAQRARAAAVPIAIDDASDADVRAALTDALAVRVGRDGRR